ncbi:MAG: hypothetical protein CL677_09400 [Bdellovibrionaceae bacterium]|mgnify:CR=1 FL=1|nr:hypothetical protein [Pseudobdellovibrionaceae bacterium]|tara:strand:+ start:15413 stop:15883 length:471 start_codon:yes stop_codon:yes gene_type:complete
MNIEYRAINPEDFEEVKYFFLTHEYSWRDSDPENFVPKSEEDRIKVANKFMQELQDPKEKYHCLAAFVNDQIVGSHFLDRYKIDGKNACHIHGLWIDPEYRNKGIAKTLKLMGEDWARSKDCQLMDSNVYATNKEMISLNKSLGYEIARYNFRKEL